MSIGLRIKQARRRRGFSLRDLSDRAGVSHTAISQYERGIKNPGSDTLIRLSRSLDVGLDFFLRPTEIGAIEPVYRKQKALKKKEEYQIIEEIRDWLERYLEAEKLCPVGGEASFDYPPAFPRKVQSFDEVEAAAIALRKAWDIGLDPMEDLTGHLEDKGIKIGRLDAPDAFDACAFIAEANGGVPVIVTRKGLPGDRQRFNLAHELGHIMLEVEENAEERFSEERACHRFAGAFIAPRPTLLDDIGEHRQHFSVNELHLLKHKYGLSMQALIYRANDLDVISDSYKKSLFDRFDERNWKVVEPGESVEPETPTRFRLLVLQAVAEEIISPRRATQLYKEPLETPEEQEAFGSEDLQVA